MFGGGGGHVGGDGDYESISDGEGNGNEDNTLSFICTLICGGLCVGGIFGVVGYASSSSNSFDRPPSSTPSNSPSPSQSSSHSGTPSSTASTSASGSITITSTKTPSTSASPSPSNFPNQLTFNLTQMVLDWTSNSGGVCTKPGTMIITDCQGEVYNGDVQSWLLQNGGPFTLSYNLQIDDPAHGNYGGTLVLQASQEDGWEIQQATGNGANQVLAQIAGDLRSATVSVASENSLNRKIELSSNLPAQRAPEAISQTSEELSYSQSERHSRVSKARNNRRYDPYSRSVDLPQSPETIARGHEQRAVNVGLAGFTLFPAVASVVGSVTQLAAGETKKQVVNTVANKTAELAFTPESSIALGATFLGLSAVAAIGFGAYQLYNYFTFPSNAQTEQAQEKQNDTPTKSI